MSKWVWFSVCIGWCLGSLLYGLDTTIAADVQGSILESLGEIEKLSWVGSGFPMGSVATILLLGYCYGLFQIKWVYLGSIVLFEIGSAICGAAPTMDALIVGRVLAGIGGAGMYLGCLTYIAMFTSLKERSLYNALAGFCWGVGCILGPVIGGAFADSNATWRWAFYINLVLAAVSAPIYIFCFPRCDPHPNLIAKEKWKKVDWLGAFLMMTLICLLTIVLSFAGSTWRWQSGGSIALWVLFGLSLIAFSLQQTFAIFTTEEHRLFPVQFLKSRTLILFYFGTEAAGTGLFITIYYVPLYFQFTKDDSAIEAAVRLLPFITVVIFFIMFSGALLPMFAWYNAWYLISGAFILIGSSLMLRVTQTTHAAAIYGFEIIIAIGTGLSVQIGYSLASAKVKPHEVAQAIGFINVAQIGSVSIALSISGSIFQNMGFKHLQDSLAPYNFTESQLRLALSGAQSTLFSNSSAQVKELAIGAVTRTISSIYGLLIAAGVLMVMSAIFMKREKLQLTHSVAGG
ncbi:hypothetical protein OIDMADRAFT_45814 [Oidiodendron maius Zn]|uniref:Major facilitator superfamily (MFS) profile domain-containing protein n=1 Tax=Oidiodendron maius (strain Zn) TaxID=913774 RepID=A0A0C3GE77_OIDMZ|nr:hypothetical protein OIDMADRAFT_45814 [Oidiodendron maius Zn]